MNVRQTSRIVALACVLAMAVTAAQGGADRAEQSYTEGNTLLAKAMFGEALKAFAQAAKADPNNQEYRQQYALVRRVMKMREGIDKESNPEKWDATAQALRSFYYANNLPAEAVTLDRMAHERKKSADSAELLAESLVATNANGEAIEVLDGFGDNISLHGKALRGIACGREGRIDEAKVLAEACKLADDTPAGVVYDVARLQALIGDQDSAIKLLVRSFESTPPSQLDIAKQNAKACPDWSKLLASADFSTAMETASKIKESGCSGGSSCGSCPSRGSCGSSKTASSVKKEH